MGKTKVGPRGRKHIEQQMERFKSGKLLRTSSGERLDPTEPEDMQQALAIFYSEADKGEQRGFAKREWKGSVRMRPRKET